MNGCGDNLGHVEKSIGGLDHTGNSTTQSCNLLMIPGSRSTDKSVIPYSRTYHRIPPQRPRPSRNIQTAIRW
ncbi:unnamed protein product [Macrosiphum euphorbiae]|uniref:Uncharacterized protein n=1 Tax=Macrosiphum euphorbiae TaxID=13131 RepID=A0AAV0X1W5_9HEMI|nr:unnamed protein product [Macrosiphum euphorbiae]